MAMFTATGIQKTYQDECSQLRRHLIDLLSRPAVGRRSWFDTLKIGDALIELDRQADSMDKEAKIGRYREQPEPDYAPELPPRNTDNELLRG